MSAPLFYVYPGPSETEESITNTLGQQPQGITLYVQRQQVGSLVSLLTPLVKKKYHLQVGCGAANDKTAFPQGSLELMKGLADRTPLAVAWWTEYLTRCETVAKLDPGLLVILAPLVEPETGYMQGSHNSTSVALGEPTTGTPAQRPKTLETIGRFHSEFYKLAAAKAPSCIKALWIGGTALRYAERNAMFSAMPVGPQRILTDPYNHQHSTDTAKQTWAPKIADWRSAAGKHHSHFVRWNSPPIGLGETGIKRTAYTDAEMAAWLSTFYEGAVELDLVSVNYFNSAGPIGNEAILNSGFPQSVAAYSGELTQAKAAIPIPPVTGGEPMTDVDKIVYDMFGAPLRSDSTTLGAHEGPLEGVVPNSYDFYKGARRGVIGPYPTAGYVSAHHLATDHWTHHNAWGALVVQSGAHSVRDVRVHLEGLEILHLVDGSWRVIRQGEATMTKRNLSGGYYQFQPFGKTMDLTKDPSFYRKETVGWSVSLKPMINETAMQPNVSAACFHFFWPDLFPRLPFSGDKTQVAIRLRAKLISDDPTVDVSKARFLLHVSGDLFLGANAGTYVSSKTGAKVNPPFAAPRWRKLSGEWQNYGHVTGTEAEIRGYPVIPFRAGDEPTVPPDGPDDPDPEPEDWEQLSYLVGLLTERVEELEDELGAANARAEKLRGAFGQALDEARTDTPEEPQEPLPLP